VRKTLQYIGYEVAQADMKGAAYRYFTFDSLSRKELDRLHCDGKPLKLVIRPTSATGAKGCVTEWEDAELIITYIPKRRYPVEAVDGLKITKEKGMIKLSWNGVKNPALKGYYVVRNSFHPPRHFMDGVKLYGGRDTWTYDNFGSTDTEKYYAVFAYDDVPNYSEPTVIKYDPLEKY